MSEGFYFVDVVYKICILQIEYVLTILICSLSAGFRAWSNPSSPRGEIVHTEENIHEVDEFIPPKGEDGG